MKKERLLKELDALGIKVVANKIKASEVRKILAAPTKTKVKEKSIIDDLLKDKEDLRDQMADSILRNIKKAGQQLSTQKGGSKVSRKGKKDDFAAIPEIEEVERGAVFNFDGIGQFDIKGIEADPDFDFDKLFDQLKEVKVKFPKMADEWEDTFDLVDDYIDLDQDLKVAFQSEGLEMPGPKEVGPAKDIDPKKAINKIRNVLHQEFLTPAMSQGMPVLPAVYQALANLAAKHPDSFDEAFSAALNAIRLKEDAMFSQILNIEVPHNQVILSAGAKPVALEIMRVLKKYYDLVLKEAAKNQDNLQSKLKEVFDQVGPEKFAEFFKEALEIVRRVEEEAFKGYITPAIKKGSKNRLKASTAEVKAIKKLHFHLKGKTVSAATHCKLVKTIKSGSNIITKAGCIEVLGEDNEVIAKIKFLDAFKKAVKGLLLSLVTVNPAQADQSNIEKYENSIEEVAKGMGLDVDLDVDIKKKGSLVGINIKLVDVETKDSISINALRSGQNFQDVNLKVNKGSDGSINPDFEHLGKEIYKTWIKS